ncbi:MAG: hypothetical protein EB025_08945 [Chitinophagaceae bacterium]|jgi:hypothetical protein|nr:hypothetical protein [Chitinophagaceae bacterium]NDB84449.1 hypothetical protein [Alphaproteobacteria bacterium]
MGSNFANDLALADNLTIENQIAIHLSANHYPPVPAIMVQPCVEAIDAVNDAGLWDLEIPLPEGVSWRGLTTAPAHAIIEQHHLDAWLIEREEI